MTPAFKIVTIVGVNIVIDPVVEFLRDGSSTLKVQTRVETAAPNRPYENIHCSLVWLELGRVICWACDLPCGSDVIGVEKLKGRALSEKAGFQIKHNLLE